MSLVEFNSPLPLCWKTAIWAAIQTPYTEQKLSVSLLRPPNMAKVSINNWKWRTQYHANIGTCSHTSASIDWLHPLTFNLRRCLGGGGCGTLHCLVSFFTFHLVTVFVWSNLALKGFSKMQQLQYSVLLTGLLILSLFLRAQCLP